MISILKTALITMILIWLGNKIYENQGKVKSAEHIGLLTDSLVAGHLWSHLWPIKLHKGKRQCVVWLPGTTGLKWNGGDFFNFEFLCACLTVKNLTNNVFQNNDILNVPNSPDMQCLSLLCVALIPLCFSHVSPLTLRLGWMYFSASSRCSNFSRVWYRSPHESSVMNRTVGENRMDVIVFCSFNRAVYFASNKISFRFLEVYDSWLWELT